MNTYLITPERAPLFAHLADTRTAEKIVRGEVLAVGAVANEGGSPKAAGLLACRLDEEIAEIVWLYVAEEYRRQGCATALLWRLLDALVMEETLTEVTAAFTPAGDALPLKELLEEIGFEEETPAGAGCYESAVGELTPLKNLGARVTGQILSLDSTPEICLKLLNRNLAQSETGDAVNLPINAQDYHPASTVYIENGQIKGMLLISSAKEGEVSVSWLYAASGNPRILPALFEQAVPKVLAAFPPDTKLTFGVTGSAAASLAKKLLPHAVFREVCVMSLDLADKLDQEG